MICSRKYLKINKFSRSDKKCYANRKHNERHFCLDPDSPLNLSPSHGLNPWDLRDRDRDPDIIPGQLPIAGFKKKFFIYYERGALNRDTLTLYKSALKIGLI